MLPKITKDAVEILINRMSTDKEYVLKHFREIASGDPHLFATVVALSKDGEFLRGGGLEVREGFLRGAFIVYSLLLLQEEIEETDDLWDME